MWTYLECGIDHIWGVRSHLPMDAGPRELPPRCANFCALHALLDDDQIPLHPVSSASAIRFPR